MAFKIPKIEYLNTSHTANTHTSTTADNISDTSDIQAGMTVTGSGVPADTMVVSVAANSVLLSAATTSSLTGTTLSFAFKIAFDYQPIEKKGRKLDAKEKIATSISGIRQVSVDYIEETRSLEFSFLTETIYNLLQTFLTTHALFGNSFRYYEDKTDTPYTDYELADLKAEARKIAPKTATTFVWSLPLTFRRAL